MKLLGVLLVFSAWMVDLVNCVDPVTHCPTFVPEGQSLYCECRFPAGAGVPDSSLVLSWPGNSTTNILTVNNVQRQDNGTEYICQMVMSGTTTTATYTLQVTYGPANSTTSISGPNPFPTDGSQSVTLRCEATEVNPTPTFSWTGVTCDNGNQANTCTFTPSPQDDGKNVMCRVDNPVSTVPESKRTAYASFTMGITEVTTQRTSPPPTTQPPTPSPTTVPVTTSSRVTTASPVTTSHLTTSPVTTQAPVTTSPTVTTTTSVVVTTSRTSTSAAVSTDTPSGTNATDAVTDQTSSTGSTSPGETTTQKKSRGSGPPVGIIAGCVAGAFVIIMIIFIIVMGVRKRRQAHVSLKDVEKNNKEPPEMHEHNAYVNKGYLSMGPSDNNSQPAPKKETTSSVPSPAIGPTQTHNNNAAMNRETDTAQTGFGYAPLVEDSAQAAAPFTESTSNDDAAVGYSTFDNYSSVNMGDSPSSSQPVTEVELTSSTGGDEYAVVNKRGTADSSLEEPPATDPNEPSTTDPEEPSATDADAYAVVNKSRGSENLTEIPHVDTFAPQAEEDAEKVPEMVAPSGDVYAVVNKPSKRSSDDLE